LSLSVEPAADRSERFAAVFWGLSLAAVCFFVLWLPVFPTGDGALHLYLSHVFFQLILHPDSNYSHFYAVRHVIQPYALVYYLLSVLETVLTPNWAEKAVICIAILLQGCGYRALTKSLGQNGNLTAFWIIPLLIGFSLGGGFVNFCLASGLAYFALSLWIGLDEGSHTRRLALFAILLLLILITHPIPLLIVEGYIAGDLALRLFTGRSQHRGGYWSTYWAQWIALIMVTLALLVPILETEHQPISIRHLFHPLYLLRGLLDLRFLVLSDGRFIAAYLYRIAVYAGLLLALVFCGSKLFRNIASRSLDRADRVFLLSLLFFIMIPFLPLGVGGGAFFAERMVDIAWPVALAPMAALTIVPKYSRVLALLLTGIVALSIFVWAREIRPVARESADLGNLPIPSGSRGIFLEPDSEGHHSWTSGFTYPITGYAGVRALVTHDAVLLNTPWMDQPIIPLTSSPGSGLLFGPQMPFEHPWVLYKMLADPAVRDKVLGESQFILFQDTLNRGVDPMRELTSFVDAASLKNWTCQEGGFYVLCVKQNASSGPGGQGSQ
jgi:hypothetical protein